MATMADVLRAIDEIRSAIDEIRIEAGIAQREAYERGYIDALAGRACEVCGSDDDRPPIMRISTRYLAPQ